MPQIWKHLMLQRIASNNALFRPETPLTAQIIFGPSPLWSASLRDESLFEEGLNGVNRRRKTAKNLVDSPKN